MGSTAATVSPRPVAVGDGAGGEALEVAAGAESLGRSDGSPASVADGFVDGAPEHPVTTRTPREIAVSTLTVKTRFHTASPSGVAVTFIASMRSERECLTQIRASSSA
jgi:hypothetical protein